MKIRRNILTILLLLATARLFAQTGNVPADVDIREKINAARPLKGGTIPADIKRRLGVAHTSGKYYLTGRPFLPEGAVKIDSLGFGVLKLWFFKTPANSYPYHSDWDFDKKGSLRQLAQHPYYREAFSLPFSTVVLNTGAVSGKRMWTLTAAEIAQEENELYDLCVYLLQTYRRRRITFILQNWEGDWIYRSGTDSGAVWKPGAYPRNIAERTAGMLAWLGARQRAVERARREYPRAACKVYHAVEVNKVLDCMKGVPGIVTEVLPELSVDMVSWSCYDGLTKDGVNLYKGIDYIKQHMRPSPAGKKAVFIGEIGIPENIAYGKDGQQITAAWDACMGALLAQQVPYIIQWELYCNERIVGGKDYYPPAGERAMRGFWLLKPDGRAGTAMQYFGALLRHPGKKINTITNNLQP